VAKSLRLVINSSPSQRFLLRCAGNARRIAVCIAPGLSARQKICRLLLRAVSNAVLCAGIAALICTIVGTAALADDGPPAFNAPNNNSADNDNHVNPLRGSSPPGPLGAWPRTMSPYAAQGPYPAAGSPMSAPYYVDPSAPPLQAGQSPGQNQPGLIGGGPTPASQFLQHFDPSGESADGQSSGGQLPGPQNGGPNVHVPSLYQPDHYPRSIGFGQPLVGTSWQNRPFHVDFFTGTMVGDDAIDGVIGQETGFFIGGRLGYDYDYYWGVESRLGTAWMSLFDRQHPENNIGTGNILVADMSLLYYPWGDSRWRPFVSVGTGLQQLDSYGSALPIYSGTLFEIPFGAGLKYRFNEWLTWRCDVIDNFAIGTGSLDTMHNVSFTAGLEYRFGGHRRTYWPWNPNPKH
jgi:Outer membrane protein beta-barrel domain